MLRVVSANGFSAFPAYIECEMLKVIVLLSDRVVFKSGLETYEFGRSEYWLACSGHLTRMQGCCADLRELPSRLEGGVQCKEAEVAIPLGIESI